MKRVMYGGIVMLIVTGLTACSNYKYYTAAKNNTNLSGYQTFGWVEVPQPTNNPRKIYSNDIAEANIIDAATQALTAKGLTPQAANPDLLVNYTALTGRGYKTNYYGGGGFYPGWGFGWGWYRPFYFGGGFGYPVREQYREGTVIIDLIDRRTGKMVWRGYGVGELRNPEKAIADLPKVVTGIIEKLDLTPGKNL